MPFTFYKILKSVLVLSFLFPISFLFSQPTSTHPDIEIKNLTSINRSTIKIEYDQVTENLYTLETNGNIRRVNFDSEGNASLSLVYNQSDHGLNNTLGIEFGSDGTLFLVGNDEVDNDPELAVVTIMKGLPDSLGSEERTWSIIAETEEYNYGSLYNHRMSAIALDPDEEYLYINSGARTDHGEERDGMREIGLTSIILKLPVDSENILLQNDREWLRENGYLMAEGIRNIFDFEFNAVGDLISVGNSGDRDDPEEMNWLREGHHYGFPWVQGGNLNPQQFTPYDPMEDPLLSPFAWGGGNLYETFSNDPDYPPAPDSITFTAGILNYGPDADKFRDTATGEVLDASDLDTAFTTLTAHRSPNGIAIDVDSVLSEDLAGGAFVISLHTGGLITPLGDFGEDLLHVALTKTEDNYIANVTRLVSGFDSPLGIEIVRNKLYVVEFGFWTNNNFNTRLYEITLPEKSTVGITDKENLPLAFKLHQNYPNPFNPNTRIGFTLNKTAQVSLTITNLMGEKVAVLIDNYIYQSGEHNINFNASGLSSGIYFYTIEVEDAKESKAMLLLK